MAFRNYQEKIRNAHDWANSISVPANRTCSAVATWFDLICCRSLGSLGGGQGIGRRVTTIADPPLATDQQDVAVGN
jgi:hypothetical protein